MNQRNLLCLLLSDLLRCLSEFCFRINYSVETFFKLSGNECWLMFLMLSECLDSSLSLKLLKSSWLQNIIYSNRKEMITVALLRVTRTRMRFPLESGSSQFLFLTLSIFKGAIKIMCVLGCPRKRHPGVILHPITCRSKFFSQSFF